MTFRQLTLHIIIAAMALTLWGCSDEAKPTDQVECFDLVQLRSASPSGASFNLYLPDGCVVLTSDGPVDIGNSQIGQFYYLAYAPEGNRVNQSATVNVGSCTHISNFTAEIKDSKDIKGWDKAPVYVWSMWRAGTHVLMDIGLIYCSGGRNFGISADKSTLEAECPDLYLVNEPKTVAENFRRQYYVAVDLEPVWKRTDADKVKIHVNNSNLTEVTEFIIHRP